MMIFLRRALSSRYHCRGRGMRASPARISAAAISNDYLFSSSLSVSLAFAADFSSLWIRRRCHARYFSNISKNNNYDILKPLFSESKSAVDDDDQKKGERDYYKQYYSDSLNGTPLNVDLHPPNASRVLSILKPEVKSLILALGALTVSTAATLQFPNAIGEIIDILSSGVPIIDSIVDDDLISDMQSTTSAQLEQQKFDKIQSISLQMLGFFTVGSAATFYHSTSFETIGQKIGARLRKQLFTTIIHQKVSFFDRNRAGELANRLSTDVHEVAEHLVQNISIFMSNLVRSITALGSMVVISPALTLYLTPLPFALGGCALVFGKFIKVWSKKHLDVLAHSTHMATERFGGITTVVSFGRRQFEVTNYSNVVESAYVFARKVAIFQGALYSSSYLVGNTALLGIMVVGSTFVIDGTMTAGQLTGFCMFAGHLAESGKY
jgi:ABC-type multidrug transport system fused ATPase/permease subunit